MTRRGVAWRDIASYRDTQCAKIGISGCNDMSLFWFHVDEDAAWEGTQWSKQCPHSGLASRHDCVAGQHRPAICKRIGKTGSLAMRAHFQLSKPHLTSSWNCLKSP